ncbi:hypothetical protein HPB47_026648 [Ixodes persulcatus]|uniref:Uncharacterized protein n=1 Tax=Ixodes persulcatus TaxID=34615 RepID=A0AC60Q012_IXOPE|nr:hypothetical protein HPB47_026648 [Ixodes persulcatus]
MPSSGCRPTAALEGMRRRIAWWLWPRATTLVRPPAWLRSRTHDSCLEHVERKFALLNQAEPGLSPYPCSLRPHRDAFELPEETFRRQYRLAKNVVRWLCDELREEPELRRLRGSWTVMTVEQQVLCALRFYATGSFQGMVASDEHIARDQATVSIVVRAVSLAIVQDDVERGFQRLGRIPGVIGCVDGTMIAIVGPSQNDPTVTKAAYWCRKQYYALDVMSIDPRYPGSVHDSFAWRYSWLRSNFEQGRLVDDGRFLLALLIPR